MASDHKAVGLNGGITALHAYTRMESGFDGLVWLNPSQTGYCSGVTAKKLPT